MISKKMKYAIKALIEIAKKTEEFIPAIVISERANIPYKFLEQILTELRKGRLINSKKGSSGGYYFIKEAKDISLADVYRLIDGPIALLPCASINYYERCSDCPDENFCTIHHALIHVRNETLSVLEKLSIDNLTDMNYFNDNKNIIS